MACSKMISKGRLAATRGHRRPPYPHLPQPFLCPPQPSHHAAYRRDCAVQPPAHSYQLPSAHFAHCHSPPQLLPPMRARTLRSPRRSPSACPLPVCSPV
eukprot:scaffold29235_cov124-Isochrysis_galbana.AAC.1